MKCKGDDCECEFDERLHGWQGGKHNDGLVRCPECRFIQLPPSIEKLKVKKSVVKCITDGCDNPGYRKYHRYCASCYATIIDSKHEANRLRQSIKTQQ